jgi:hypothetical protein
MATDVSWRDLPHICSPEPSSDRPCSFREVALQSAAPPRFTTLGLSGRPERETWRGSHVIRRIRCATIYDGVIDGTTGAVLSQSFNFVTSACHQPVISTAAARHQAVVNDSLDHLAVLVQKFGDAYSHIFFQTLPQVALLLQQSAAAGLPAPGLLVPRSDTLEALLEEGFGIPRARILRVGDRDQWRARRVSLLFLPPGACPNGAVYPPAVMLDAHRRLVEPARSRHRDLVVYLQRPRPMLRYALNDDHFRELLNASLSPRYRLVVVDPGGGAWSNREAVSTGWREMRALMARAAVVIGVHGSAFANVFFATSSQDVHLIELNQLHGRGCHVSLHQSMGANSTFWTLEPMAMDARMMRRGRLVPASRPNFYNGPVWIPTRRVLLALQAAQVADRQRVQAAVRANAHLSPRRPAWLPPQLS